MSELSENILRLRAEGKTYNEIKAELNCSKSTISFHCGEGQKEKSNNRQRKFHEENVLFKKVERFQQETVPPKGRPGTYSDEELLRFKTLDFQRTEDGARVRQFSQKDVIDKLSEDPVCYLTGREIDMSEPKTYEFDHKVPRAKGGDNSLDNLGLASKSANRAKHDLTEQEFLELCKDVLIHHGYKVEKD